MDSIEPESSTNVLKDPIIIIGPSHSNKRQLMGINLIFACCMAAIESSSKCCSLEIQWIGRNEGLKRLLFLRSVQQCIKPSHLFHQRIQQNNRCSLIPINAFHNVLVFLLPQFCLKQQLESGIVAYWATLAFKLKYRPKTLKCWFLDRII